ncbi:MAG: RDD family protein [Mycobacterium sp.]|nr:RDD family protein [Mycobacterium sp.]MBV9722972.1 RDD family protein [Mycobacterium sp.]
MTVVVELAETTPVVADAAQNNLARWHIRAAAFIVDVLPGAAVVSAMGVVCLAVPLRSTWWWVCLAVLAGATLLTLVNRAVVPAMTGWSLGRALAGIAVVRPDGTSAGIGRLTCRELAHVLDTLSAFVGWLWPLWDPHKRTFADLLLRTEVRRARPDDRPRGIRRLTAIVVSTAVLLCVAGAAVSVTAVFLPDRASDQTRAALQQQGPKIVTEILSYDPKSLRDEFARARSLTTDNYRPKLVQQQESAQKRRPIVNEYWATDWTVLSAARNRATMLLFLQGHRGDGNQQRPISATVRVSFVKTNNGDWLVDDLNVVTKPKPPRGQK